jgi:hypothetical protein
LEKLVAGGRELVPAEAFADEADDVGAAAAALMEAALVRTARILESARERLQRIEPARGGADGSCKGFENASAGFHIAVCK